MAECLPAPRTFVSPHCLQCPETAARCQPAPEKFMESCSSSVSGIKVNHNTHLAPGFPLNVLVPAPVNVVVLQALLGLCLWGGHTASTKCPPSRGTVFPVWPKDPSDLALCSWGFSLPTRAPPRYRAAEFQTLHSPCL